MKAHRRPPLGISSEQFFLQWLPAEIQRLGTAAAMPEVMVRFVIEDQASAGGVWDLWVQGGRLEASAAAAEHRPQVTLSITEQDLRAIVVGEPGPVDLAPPAASPTDLLFVDGSSVELLQAVSGTFLFEVRNYNGRTWRLRATFGDAAPSEQPDATIAIEAELYGQILARQKSAAEAYFTGGIVLLGDVERGVQVGIALMPKF